MIGKLFEDCERYCGIWFIIFIITIGLLFLCSFGIQSLHYWDTFTALSNYITLIVVFVVLLILYMLSFIMYTIGMQENENYLIYYISVFIYLIGFINGIACMGFYNINFGTWMAGIVITGINVCFFSWIIRSIDNC